MKKNFIPTINISKINLESLNSKNNIIFKQIQKACIEVGFFQIVGHGIEKNLIHKITKIAHKFFNSKRSINSCLPIFIRLISNYYRLITKNIIKS